MASNEHAKPISRRKPRAKPKDSSNVRAVAASILSELLRGSGSLTVWLAPHQKRDDYPLLQELCFGSCRWFYQLDAELSCFLTKPLRMKDADIKSLLVVGLYQLKHLRIPDHAALNETVNAVNEMNKQWARGLVNAVLRSWLRQQRDNELENLDQNLPTSPLISAENAHAHPDWLIGKIRKQYGSKAEEIAAENNRRPPMTLRCNQAVTSTQEVRAMLAAAQINSRPGKFAASALYLETPIPVDDICGFTEGLVSVQDEASQLVPEILDCQEGHRVLDACAAPGGKTCHILEHCPSIGELVGVEIEEYRLERVKQNLERLKLKAKLVVADVSSTDSWWDGDCFDRILLDAPCSATGVIRRHPDIKLLRQADDIQKLQLQQLDLLNKLWPCLKPGGVLLYTTCSILKEENSDLIEKFLNHCNNAKNTPITADWGVECPYGRQLLPSKNSHDGFFFSVLCKT